MPLVETTLDGPVAHVVLARQEQRNALSTGMIEELVSRLGDLATQPEERVVVLKGTGTDFCAGADFAELASAPSSPDAVDYGRAFEEALRAIGSHPAPVVAQVHGAALGAGCQLVVACDLALAAEDAVFGIPSARLGVLVNYENIERLVLAVGPKRAAEVLLTARRLSGSEAATWGLINEALPRDALESRVADVARMIAEAAPLSIQGSKRGIRVAVESLSLDRGSQGYRVAEFDMLAAAAFSSEDLAEGIAAFRERRPPRFTGT
jgi:enoyl-CoA hydratase